MKTFADRTLSFYKNLQLDIDLPLHIKVLNPYKNNKTVENILQKFYCKFFNDQQKRKLIVGINPGRFGAGITGVPFTDTKRLAKYCNIHIENFKTHEPSSVFVYEVIQAFGGVEKFYNNFFINSVCPLGFIQKNQKGNWINRNYYDDLILYKTVKPFIISSLKKQISLGIDNSVVFSFGKKNAKFLKEINKEEKLFKKIIPLPHPRYIMQYQFKNKSFFQKKYVEELNQYK